MDESNTLIDNSEAGELVQDNSQWHPGFSALGSVPGMLPTGTLHPTLQIATQAGAGTSPDEDPESELDAEDEEDEEMDDDDNFDDAFEEDALVGTVAPTGGGLDVNVGLQSPAPEISPPNPFSHPPEPPDFESLLSNEDSTLSEEYSDLPDLEEIPVEDQNEQQTDEGNAQTQDYFFRLTNARVRSARRTLESSISKAREKRRTILAHYTCQNLSQLRRSTFQHSSNGRTGYPPVPRHPVRCRLEKTPARLIPQPSPLPASIESKNATGLQLLDSTGTSQHDSADP